MENGIPQEVIDKVKAAHPGVELRLWTSEEGDTVICKAPNRGEYKRFLHMVADAAQRAQAPETLLFGCLVYPTPQELGAMLERRPGLGVLFGGKLGDWAGSNQEVAEKKL
jgi:hypothetical protein